MNIDLDARYSVDGYRGIAFYLLGYVETPDTFDDGEPTGYTNVDESLVRAVMVGDDRVHIVDVEDLTRLEDDAYCSCCGQIGCTWN